MATSNNYTLVLQAKIDQSVIDSQIIAIKNKLASMNFNIGGAATGGGGGGGGTGGASLSVKLAAGQKAINDKIAEWNKIATPANEILIKRNDLTGQAIRATNSYTEVSGKAITETVSLNEETGAFASTISQTKGGITSANEATRSWTANIENNIFKVIQWAVATTAIYGTLKKIQEGISYITDLNKALIDAQIVTGMTEIQVASLGRQYNVLAKNLGATTLQVADASIEFLRQGKTVEETQKLVTDSVMMSKLANMDSASSTEALTAIMNGFQLKVEDLTSVIDKLVKLDNAYATSVAEISSAMQRSASAASLAGVSYEELASYITVVSATTRKSAESIGESFKTIFARMENVAAGKTVDEFGDSINNVEKVLTKYGIALRDANLQFRPMGDVLDEIGAKWNTYGATQKAQIAGAIAGVRQYTNLIAMMDNYDKVLQAQAMETTAAGLAQSRYQIYLKGVEAAQNKLTAATQHLWMDAIDGGLIVSVLNAGTKILEFVDKLGGLESVLVAIVAIFAILNAESLVGFIGTIGKMIPLVFGATGGFISLATAATAAATATAIATAGLSLIIGAIALFVIGVNSANAAAKNHAQVMDEYAQSVQKVKDEFDQLTSKISSKSKNVEETQKLVDEYNNLYKTIGKSVEQQQRFNDLSNQLKFLLPEINGYFDAQGNFIVINTADLQKYVDLKKQEVDLLKQQRALMLTSTIIPNMEKDVHWAQATLEGLQSQQDYYMEQQARAKSLVDAGTKGNIRVIDMTTGIVETKSAADALSFFNSKLEMLPGSIEEARINYQLLLNQLAQQKLELSGLNPVIDANNNLLNTNAVQTGLTADETKALRDAIDQYAQVVSSASGAVSDYISIAQKQKDETLTQDDIIKLAVAHSDYIQFIKVESGALVIDTEALRQYNIMQLKAQQFAIGRAIATMQAAGATKAETQALNEQLAALGLLIGQASQPINYSPATGGAGTAKDPVQEMIDKIKEEKQAQKQALQDQLDAYKKIIDTRKELLKSLKDEAAYKDLLAEKEQSLSAIQNELTELALDNSEEAKAKRLQLAADEAKAQNDIQKVQADRSYDLQVAALDKQLQLYTDFIDAQMSAIDTFLKDTVALMAEALARLGAGAGTGVSGGTNKLTLAPWATQADVDYARAHPDQYDVAKINANLPAGTHHRGLDSGFVGGVKSNEKFVKALKGELFVTPNQMTAFMNKTLPSMISNAANAGGITVDKLINIEGNADASVIPDLERIGNQVLEKLNKSLFVRGYKRAVNNYSS